MTANSNDLSDADLADIMELSFGARTKWYNIGLGLGLHYTILDGIAADSVTADTCFRKMLVEWLHSGKIRTWRALAEAMGKITVGRHDLKDEILKKIYS